MKSVVAYTVSWGMTLVLMFGIASCAGGRRNVTLGVFIERANKLDNIQEWCPVDHIDLAELFFEVFLDDILQARTMFIENRNVTLPVPILINVITCGTTSDGGTGLKLLDDSVKNHVLFTMGPTPIRDAKQRQRHLELVLQGFEILAGEVDLEMKMLGYPFEVIVRARRAWMEILEKTQLALEKVKAEAAEQAEEERNRPEEQSTEMNQFNNILEWESKPEVKADWDTSATTVATEEKEDKMTMEEKMMIGGEGMTNDDLKIKTWHETSTTGYDATPQLAHRVSKRMAKVIIFIIAAVVAALISCLCKRSKAEQPANGSNV